MLRVMAEELPDTAARHFVITGLTPIPPLIHAESRIGRVQSAICKR